MPLLDLNTLVAGLRPEQSDAVAVGVAHLLAGKPGHEGSLLLVSPTGTGKSYMQGAIHRTIREVHGKAVVTTFPQSEIAEAVFIKTYGAIENFALTATPGPTARQRILEAKGFWTIKRLYNELTKGKAAIPDYLQHDEAHHSVDDTHEITHGICGLCPRVGATATDYRGTAVETALLRERWPRMHRVLTLKNAVLLGRLSMPSWDVWPLLNDELIDVKGGEFSVSSVESHLADKLDDLCSRIAIFWQARVTARWDRPTMIAVSGVGAVEMVVDRLKSFGLPAVGVTGDTSDKDRAEAFAACVQCRAILVQIRVVGEGVDLRIRRLIDLAPTVSPVLWMQRVGRITRPVPNGEAAPEYIACCHNLARHAYLWHGVMPVSAIKKATTAWGDAFKPSRRFLARAIDIGGLGRFEPGAVPFLDAGTGTIYSMQTKDGLREFAVLLHPLRPEPWFFARANALTGEKIKAVVGPGIEIEYNEKTYGKWAEVKSLPDLKGCVSIKATPLQPAQVDWWKRSAKAFGLDPDAEITNREFQALPIIVNARPNLKV